MQKLIFRNAKGTEINLTELPFGVTNWEGFSNTSLNIQTQQVPFQDGGVYLDSLLEQRELSVTVAVCDNNDLEERYRLKRVLISALNPKLGEGTLIYTNDFLSRQITVIPQLPIFENKNSNDSGTLKASCVFTACNPYWEDLKDTEVTFQLGQQPIIKNEGDVSCQLEMDWFTSYVKNGQVTNVTQNQKIKYNGDLNDSLKIVTEVGKKSVITEKMGFNISNIGTQFNDICYSSKLNLFVTVGNSGTIITSPNAISWTSRTSGVSINVRGITYSDELNLFVAVGNSGTILTSSDGINWTSRTSGVSTTLNGITYSSELGLFVIVGNSGTILHSAFSLAENQIQNISADSDIGMNLGIGDNKFRINKDSGNMVVRIKFRQKYIGV